MGLKNGNSSITYLRLREGKFYVGKDKENGQGELEGRITGLRFKDEEYEGSPVRKLIVTVTDDETDEVFQLGLNTDSQNYSTFVSFLKGADVSEKLTLHPKVETVNKDGKDFKKNSILISQDGTFMKGYFTAKENHGAPAWKTVTVGKKKITDKSEYLAFMEQFVEENYIDKLGGSTAASKTAPSKSSEQPVEEDEVVVTEKLPWDEQ